MDIWNWKNSSDWLKHVAIVEALSLPTWKTLYYGINSEAHVECKQIGKKRWHGSILGAILRHTLNAALLPVRSGSHSMKRLGGIAEKFDLPPFSEQMAVSKMVASIEGSHLHLKEQLWLAETSGHFIGALGHFWLLFQVHHTSRVPPKQTLNANLSKNCCGDVTEATLRANLNAALMWQQHDHCLAYL